MRQLAILYWNARNFLKSYMLEARQGGSLGPREDRAKPLYPLLLGPMWEGS